MLTDILFFIYLCAALPAAQGVYTLYRYWRYRKDAKINNRPGHRVK